MLNSVLTHLRSFQSIDPFQNNLATSYIAFLESEGEAMLWKPLGAQHITASTFVFSPERDQVLLTYHRKGNFWVQFGGHLEEADRTLEAAARREAREESGIATLDIVGGVVDLDRHELHGGFTCDRHWDIGFVAVVEPDVDITVSDESVSVSWWPIDDLPADATPDLPVRLRRAAKYLAAQA